MRLARLLAWTAGCFLLACQPTSASNVTIIDNDNIITLQTQERTPSGLLAQAAITLGPNDRVLLNGLPIAPDQPITDFPITLQIRRSRTLTLSTSSGQHNIASSAFTIGQALQEASVSLHARDETSQAINAPISNSPVSILPSRDLTITVDGKNLQVTSSARTVGQALAEAGIPLLGLDYSLPAESDLVPSDGQIRVVRVSESLVLAQKAVPFENVLQASADVPLDQTQILQPGELGLTVQRTRIRYEDGKEISRQAEDETLVRSPRTRVLGYGTKIEVRSATVDGVTIEYWRAVQMYATSYSPCRSGGDKCYSGTSSGQPLRKGMVGLRYDLYLSMQGQRLYIPGYGFGSVADVCNGCVGKPWIDLGFSDSNFEAWHSWVTVYFLTPMPANVVYDLE